MNADAVKAAAEALLRRSTEPGWSRDALAEAAVAAAEPIIRAAVAAEIRADVHPEHGACDMCEGRLIAARIAEGAS